MPPSWFPVWCAVRLALRFMRHAHRSEAHHEREEHRMSKASAPIPPITQGPPPMIVCSVKECAMSFFDIHGRGDRRTMCLDHADELLGERCEVVAQRELRISRHSEPLKLIPAGTPGVVVRVDEDDD